MNDLLQVAVNAHGGLEQRNQLKTVMASSVADRVAKLS
jgi:hypothetical protein